MATAASTRATCTRRSCLLASSPLRKPASGATAHTVHVLATALVPSSHHCGVWTVCGAGEELTRKIMVCYIHDAEAGSLAPAEFVLLAEALDAFNTLDTAQTGHIDYEQCERGLADLNLHANRAQACARPAQATCPCAQARAAHARVRMPNHRAHCLGLSAAACLLARSSMSSRASRTPMETRVLRCTSSLLSCAS